MIEMALHESYFPAMQALARLAALLVASVPANSQEPDAAIVAKEVSAVIKALYDGDHARILKHTHPRVLALVGGESAFSKVMKESTKTLKDAGFSFQKVEFGKIEYVAGKEHEFVLIPTKITVKTADGPDVTPGYQFGVKKKTEKVWSYIDCSSLTDRLAREWFPDFPKDRKVPEG